MRDLERMFRPRSVALVGASDKSPWSGLIYANFRGFSGALHLVNRRGADAHGMKAHASCVSIGEPVDLAYIFVPTEAVHEALADAVTAGIRNVLILSSGFAETGAEGAVMQAKLADLAAAHGVSMLGPNCLGFLNYADGLAVTAMRMLPETRKGGVAIVSQSGATAHGLVGFATQQGIGLSHVVTTGNEADLDAAAIIDFLVGDAATRVVALFTEGVRRPDAFLAAARRAADAEKPIVVLKVGRTELAKELAQAHTGALVGDDRVFDAVCQQENIVRASSPEELLITAGLLAETGKIARGVAIISISGGACELIADRAADVGLSLPRFSETTSTALRDVLPAFGTSVLNPLDVTGAAVSDPTIFERTLKILADDPSIGMTACVYDLANSDAAPVGEKALACIGRGLQASATPGVLVNQTMRPLTPFALELKARHGIPAITGGLDHAVAALARAARWSRARKRKTPSLPKRANDRPTSERETLAFLARHNTPVVPHALAATASDAVTAARSFGDGVVLKIASPDILHKSELGGVRLDVRGDAAIAAAFEEIVAAARAARPDARVEGCLVMPMRRGGVELFVGVAASSWGPVIAVGLGGVWVEVLQDTALRLLPITTDDARDMLDALKGRRLLAGYRGAAAVSIDAVAEAIQAIGDAALALGPDLTSLEVNPLRVDGERAEALDALAVWRTA